MTCSRTVSINFPCSLSDGHSGVCQPDIHDQLRLYGVSLEEARELARAVADAQRFGLVRRRSVIGADGMSFNFTALGRYPRLRAALDRLLPRSGGHGVVRVSDVQRAIEEAESAWPS